MKYFDERIRSLTRSKFNRDIGFLAIAQLVLIIGGLILNYFIGLFLGAEALGIFNQSLAFYMILAVFAGLGLNNNLLNKIPSIDNKDEIGRLLASNLMLTLSAATILSIGVVILAYAKPALFSSAALAEVLIVQMVSLPLFALNRNIAAYFGGKRMQNEVAKIRIVRWGGLIVCVVFSVLLAFPLKYLMWSFTIAELFVLFVALVRLPIAFMTFDFSLIFDHLSFGLKSLISELVGISNNQSEVLILGYTLSPEEVGVFSFMLLFVRVLYVLPGILMQNLNPVISKYWAKSKHRALKRVIHRLIRRNTLVNLFASAMIVVGFWVIAYTMKGEFLAYAYYLPIALLGVYVFSTVSFMGSSLIMIGALRANIVRTLLILVITILSTYLLSNTFGFVGALWSISVTSIAATMILVIFVKKYMRINLLQVKAKTL